MSEEQIGGERPNDQRPFDLTRLDMINMNCGACVRKQLPMTYVCSKSIWHGKHISSDRTILFSVSFRKEHFLLTTALKFVDAAFLNVTTCQIPFNANSDNAYAQDS